MWRAGEKIGSVRREADDTLNPLAGWAAAPVAVPEDVTAEGLAQSMAAVGLSQSPESTAPPGVSQGDGLVAQKAKRAMRVRGLTSEALPVGRAPAQGASRARGSSVGVPIAVSALDASGRAVPNKASRLPARGARADKATDRSNYEAL